MGGVAWVLGWLRTHDPGLVATRRAGRTAVVMPALFALCTQVLHSPTMASFAAFGSFSMLLLVDFSGPMVERLRAQAGLALAWAVLICLGTLVAHRTWLAVLTTVVVAFAVLFSGVVSSVLAGSATALLLGFVLPVATPVPLSLLPDRLAGAGLAAAAALPAVALLWPRPVVDPLSGPAARVCRAAADRLRTDAALLGAPASRPAADLCHSVADRAARASADLRRAFDATPYRPTGLSTSSRTLVRLVDELTWLSTVLADRPAYTDEPPACDPAALSVRLAAAEVLDRAADLLTDPRGDVGGLRDGIKELRVAMRAMEDSSTVRLPVERPVGEGAAEVYGFIATLDLSFRAHELGYAVLQIAGNVDLAATAWQRSWPDQLLGREPDALTAPLATARERASAHLGWGSVWLHNSMRGAAGLGVAVLLADLTSVQHSFWVLLGTLSVLRSNALNTGQNAMRAVLGTVIGSILGAGLLQLIGHHGTVLWFLLPVAILLAGIAPAAISFTAGQAAFTVTLVILFNIGQNPDWQIALLRVQDIALGCAVSVVVALFFWPRGAAAAVDRALARAYSDSARYLSAAVEYALGHYETSPATPAPGEPTQQGHDAAAAARRLDDAFRSYLAERGAKPLSLADMTTLVTGVVGLRLAADAVVSLWQDCRRVRTKAHRTGADQTEAHRAILVTATRVTDWYHGLAASLDGHTPVPVPVPLGPESAARLVESVRTDLVDREGQATATAVRVIWTGDHVDVARRLQPGLAAAAQESPPA
ncbi:FUSC family protein [Streptacidiphilus sp. NEAU-YB345]|uniref:FUSC family protein n=1 Tax=Streptacidiphilus fuscans TaxID=2789292 RepID=A0A931B0M9_9ACTN|nr:FUSC family protein [Streptacidiphilus fuscans]